MTIPKPMVRLTPITIQLLARYCQPFESPGKAIARIVEEYDILISSNKELFEGIIRDQRGKDDTTTTD